MNLKAGFLGGTTFAVFKKIFHISNRCLRKIASEVAVQKWNTYCVKLTSVLIFLKSYNLK